MKHNVIDALLLLLVPIDTLHPDPANAREGHDVEGIAASLVKYGQRTPLVFNSDGTVEKGNGTLAAAKSLGWTHVAAAGVDDEAIIAAGYSLVDNELGAKSRFNLDRLKRLTDSIPQAEELPGFDLARLEEIRGMCAEPELPDLGDGSEQPLPEQFMIMIECSSEIHQTHTLEKLTDEGYQCRALLS